MAKKKDPGFPKQIFVYREEPESGVPYLEVDESADQQNVEEGQAVAVYELRAVKTKRVAHSLE